MFSLHCPDCWNNFTWPTRLSICLVIERQRGRRPCAQATTLNFLFWTEARLWREKNIFTYLLWKWKQRKGTGILLLFQSSVTRPEVVIINSERLLTLIYKTGWKSFADKLKTTKKKKRLNFITLNWISCFFELLVFSHVAIGIKAASYYHFFVRISAFLYSRFSKSKDRSSGTKWKVCCFRDMLTYLYRVSLGTARTSSRVDAVAQDLHTTAA